MKNQKEIMVNKLQSKYFVYDLESDGLLDTATVIHCLSIGWVDQNGVFQVKSTTDYDEMRNFFSNDNIVKIGHNIVLYDNRLVEKLLGCKVNDKTVIDTLTLSWYLFPTLDKHGLEEWGTHFGIKKPEIKDWKNLSSAQYIHRCQEDIKINYKLWKKELKELRLVYDDDLDEMERLIDYLQNKLFNIRTQEDNPIKFDTKSADELLIKLEGEKATKMAELGAVMPKVPNKVTKIYKDVIVLDKDTNDICMKGDMLYDHYLAQGYKTVAEYSIDKIKGYEEPNPNSTDQKKEWLYSLGWIPETFSYKKEEDGSQRKIPQIMSDKKDGTLCNSIVKLFEKEPKLEILEGLSILTHRIGVVKSLIRDSVNGYIAGSMAGITNTLRLKHKRLVNLPGESKAYGAEIRGLLIAEDGDLLCGSDMSALEDTTKQHYIYKYDPKYVNEMRTPGFDPHLDIAVLAGLMTEDQSKEHKLYDKTKGKEGVSHKKTRFVAKTTNFSATYGAGPPKIAQTAGITLKQGKLLHSIYWKRNAAVKRTAQDAIVKLIGSQKWLYNSVSRFWYSLRAEKDRFSTLNQSTAVYCFDTWVKYLQQGGIAINYQCHDEVLFKLNGVDKDTIKLRIGEAIDKTNQETQLNVPLAVSVDFGYSYSSCH